MAQDLFLEPVETDMPAQPEPAPAPADDGPPPPSAEAPYGWTSDGAGGWRPKKTAGRRKIDEPPKPPAGISPSLEDLKAQRAAEGPRREDIAPTPPPRSKRGTDGRFRKKEAAAPQPSTPFRAGPIAKGINRIYRKAGKIIRVWDPLIGEAVISCTRKEDEDDTTVGEAWEELARVNPRVRAFLERIIQGGAVGGIVAAHAPIFMAIMMKDSIRNRLPFGNLVGAFLDRDDDDPQGPAGGLGGLLGDMSPEDMATVMQMAQGMMGGMFAGMPRDTGAPMRQPGPGDVVIQGAVLPDEMRRSA